MTSAQQLETSIASLRRSSSVLGLDIGGTKTACVEGTLDGEILARVETPTRAGEPFLDSFPEIVRTLRQLMDDANQRGRRIVALSVSVGGPLRIEEGQLLNPPHLPGWHNVNLKEHLKTAFPTLPIYMEHDGNAGALAEFHFGVGKARPNLQQLIFLTFGTGIGAGMIVNGRILHGASDTAGEVGHWRLAEDGPLGFGKKGSLESFASGAGLVELAREMFPSRWNQETPIRELVDAILHDDPDALRVAAAAGKWLGRGLALLIDAFNPQVIVLGALAVVLGDRILAPARQVIEAEALPQARAACEILPSVLGNRIGDVAALMAALTQPSLQRALQEKTEMNPTLENELIQKHLDEHIDVVSKRFDLLRRQITVTAERIIHALSGGKKLLIFGNGGSATQASHFAGELVGRFSKGPRRPLPAIALGTDMGVTTSIGNDFGFDSLFSRQIEALAQPGDIAIGFTTSGESENVRRAFIEAAKKDAITIALTGAAGLREDRAQHILKVPSSSTATIQEVHLMILHMWCIAIDAAFTPQTLKENKSE